tara:strand:+ start:925 stop:1329 length:405 start_codon:yes stop_codon:yes gene_type:complete
MIIGVPKEVKNNEYRVGLTPESSMALCKEGHEVLIQSDAGSSIGFSNQDYIDSGAKIIDEAEEVFDKSNLIIKVKEPIEQELEYLREDLTLFTYLHLAGKRKVVTSNEVEILKNMREEEWVGKAIKYKNSVLVS